MQQKQQQHHAIMENQTQTLLHCKPAAAYSRSSSISSNWRHFTLLPCLSALPCLSPASCKKTSDRQLSETFIATMKGRDHAALSTPTTDIDHIDSTYAPSLLLFYRDICISINIFNCIASGAGLKLTIDIK